MNGRDSTVERTYAPEPADLIRATLVCLSWGTSRMKKRERTKNTFGSFNIELPLKKFKRYVDYDTNTDAVSRDAFSCLRIGATGWYSAFDTPLARFEVVKNLPLGDNNIKICQTCKHSLIDGPSPHRLQVLKICCDI